MARNMISKYVWIIETIYKSGRISFKELNERWLDDDISTSSTEAMNIQQTSHDPRIMMLEEEFAWRNEHCR